MYQLGLLALQLVVNIAIIGTFFVYYRQLRVMQGQLLVTQNASGSQNLLNCFQFLQQPHVRNARRVLINLKDKPFNEWTTDDRAAANTACGSYDVVANLAKWKVIPLEPLVDVWGYSIVKCYAAAEPLITEYRKPKGRAANYWDDFEWLWREVRARRDNQRAY